MAIANETNPIGAGLDDDEATFDMPAARDLKALLDQIADQIADVKLGRSQSLEGMRSRASDLAHEARAARSSADDERAPNLDRIEAGMEELAGRCVSEPSFGTAEDEPWDQAAADALASLHDQEAAPAPAPSAAPLHATSAHATSAPALCPVGAGAARPAPTPAPAVGTVSAEWLDGRFAEIARRLEQTLAEFRPDASFEALLPRFDRLEEHVASALRSVGSSNDSAALGNIEAQIASLSSHVESARSQLGRLDEIEAQLKTVSAWLSDERLERLLDDHSAHGAELSRLVGAAAEQACTRIVAELGPRGRTEPAEDRDTELRALIETFMAERRVADDMTAGALDTLQQAMISLLDRVEALEPAQPMTDDVVANLGFALESQKSGPAAPAMLHRPDRDEEDDGYGDSQAGSAPATPARAVATPPPMHSFEHSFEHSIEAAAAGRSPERPVEFRVPEAHLQTGAAAGSAAPHVDGLDAARVAANPIDRIRQDMIADAQRAKARAAAEAVGGAKAKRTDKPSAAKTVSGLFAASQLFGTSKSIYGVPTKRVLIGALALLVAINGALLLIPRRSAAPATPPAAATKTPGAMLKGDDGGSATPSGAQPSDAQSQPERRSDREGVPARDGASRQQGSASLPHWSETGAVDSALAFATEQGDVGVIAEGDAVPGIMLQVPDAPLPAEAMAHLQQRKTMAEMSTRLGAAAANLSPAAYLPEGAPAAAGEPPVTSTGKPSSAAEFSPRDLPPAMVGPLSLRVAAANGDPSAEFEVGARLAEGKGVDQDLPGAVRWYQRSAARGFAQAQYRLATFYERGLGVKADTARARIWYTRASEQGNVKAMHNLAVMSAGRDSGAPDYATAAKWFAEAAEHDLQDSQFNLAVLAEAGLGVPKDAKAAYKWFSIAARDGDAEAIRRRDQVKAKLAPADVADLDQQVAAFRPKPVDRIANDPRAAGEDWKSRQGADTNS